MIYYQIIREIGWGREALLACLAVTVAIVVALVSHEVSHGLVALMNGDDTARRAGRLSLNPLVHFDPVGLLLMLFVGFGYARPVPVTPQNYKNRRLGDVTVALAGVTANLLGAFFSVAFNLLCYKWLITTEVDSAAYYIALFLWYVFSFQATVNISLALFNILPLYPLDGYRFIAAFTGEDNNFMTMLRRYAMYIMLGFFMIMGTFNFVPSWQIYSPFYWYFNVWGDMIKNGFIAMWRLII